MVLAMRPPMWLKPLFLMLVAQSYALHDLPDLGTLLYGLLIVGPLLWGGLYALNAVTDIEDDGLHPVKRYRPLASGALSPRLAAGVSCLAIAAALLLSMRVNGYFALCVAIMAVKQLLYTLPGIRLKEHSPWDIITGSLFNSSLRFSAGWFMVTTASFPPVLMLVLAESLQMAGFLVNRLMTDYSDGLEIKLGYRSTVVRYGQRAVRTGIVLLWGLGLLAFAGLIANRFLLLYPSLLGELPVQALWVLGLLILALPAFAGILGRVNRLSPRQAELYYDLPLVYVLLLAILLSVILTLYH